MENWQWAILIKPFVAVVLIFCFAYPVRRLVELKMRDGKLKLFFLIRWD